MPRRKKDYLHYINYKIIKNNTYMWVNVNRKISIVFVFNNTDSLKDSTYAKIFLGEIPENDVTKIPEESFINAEKKYQIISLFEFSKNYFKLSEDTVFLKFCTLMETHTLSKEHIKSIKHDELLKLFTMYLNTHILSHAFGHFSKTPYILEIYEKKLKKQQCCEDCGTINDLNLCYEDFKHFGIEEKNMDKLHIYCKKCSKNHKPNWSILKD